MDFKYSVDHSTSVDGITIRSLKSHEDVERVLEYYMDHFWTGEPMAVTLGGYPSQSSEGVRNQMREWLLEGVSLMAVDEKSGKVMGMRGAYVVERSKVERSIPTLDERRKTMPESHAIGEYACDTQVLWPADVFDANPEDNLIYEMYALGVHSDYRGRGLGRILVEESFKVAKSINCDSSIVIATHPHSRKIFEQLGMDTIKYVDYKYVVVEGKRPYFNANYNNSKGISSHYMKLK